MKTSCRCDMAATVLGVLFILTGAAQADESTDIPVTCPGAIHAPAPEADSGPGVEDSRLPELVLVVRKLRNTREALFTHENDYEVKRVLYGSYSQKKIKLYDFSDWCYQYPRSSWVMDDEFIVAIAPSLHRERTEYTALYHFPLSQERAEIALCQARLDYAALASTCIFIGKEVSLGWNGNKEDDPASRRNYSWLSTVEVIRVISGEPLKPGERLRVGEDGATRFSNLHPRAHPQARLFFVSHGKSNDANPVYEVLTHQPVEQEGRVLEALKHRNDYLVVELKVKEGGLTKKEVTIGGGDPFGVTVVEVKEEPVTKKSREITFRGTNAEAIELLDAQHEGAFMLMYRTLMHRRKTSKAGVVAAIEKNMFCLQSPVNAQGDVFLRQERLIDLLTDMERQDGGNDVERLTETYVAHLERSAADSPDATRSPSAGPDEQSKRSYSGNDTLRWLLQKQNEERCSRKYSERLLNLRKNTGGPWRDVVEGAVKQLNVDDTLE